MKVRTRYLGVSDWWGRHVWVERAGVRTALRYRGEHRMPGFAWGRRGLAARELSRSLIEDATNQVGDGSRLAEQAGKVMQDMVSSVLKVTATVEQIAAASQVQAQDISTANQALQSIGVQARDQAQMVDDLARSARVLEADADALFALVNGDEVGQPPQDTPAVEVLARRA